MSAAAPVGDLDGIVVLELTIDSNEAVATLAALRMGIAAYEHAPAVSPVDAALRGSSAARLWRIADELANAIEATKARREQAYRKQARAERRKARS